MNFQMQRRGTLGWSNHPFTGTLNSEVHMTPIDWMRSSLPKHWRLQISKTNWWRWLDRYHSLNGKGKLHAQLADGQPQYVCSYAHQKQDIQHASPVSGLHSYSSSCIHTLSPNLRSQVTDWTFLFATDTIRQFLLSLLRLPWGLGILAGRTWQNLIDLFGVFWDCTHVRNFLNTDLEFGILVSSNRYEYCTLVLNRLERVLEFVHISRKC